MLLAAERNTSSLKLPKAAAGEHVTCNGTPPQGADPTWVHEIFQVPTAVTWPGVAYRNGMEIAMAGRKTRVWLVVCAEKRRIGYKQPDICCTFAVAIAVRVSTLLTAQRPIYSSRHVKSDKDAFAVVFLQSRSKLLYY